MVEWFESVFGREVTLVALGFVVGRISHFIDAIIAEWRRKHGGKK